MCVKSCQCTPPPPGTPPRGAASPVSKCKTLNNSSWTSGGRTIDVFWYSMVEAEMLGCCSPPQTSAPPRYTPYQVVFCRTSYQPRPSALVLKPWCACEHAQRCEKELKLSAYGEAHLSLYWLQKATFCHLRVKETRFASPSTRGRIFRWTGFKVLNGAAKACQSDAPGCSWNGRRLFSSLHQQSRASMAPSTIELGFLISRVERDGGKARPIVWRTGHRGPVGLASDGLSPSLQVPLPRLFGAFSP